MSRFLVLTPGDPFPPRDGVGIRVCELLKLLDGEIDLLAFGDRAAAEPLPASLRGTLRVIPRPPRPARGPLAQSLFGRPTTLETFLSDDYAAAVNAAVGKRPDLVIAIGLQMGQYLDRIPASIPRVLDDFNVEWRVLDRLADTKEGLRRAYWKREAAKLRDEEARLLRAAGQVIATSDVDREALQELAPRSRFWVVGASVPSADSRPGPRSEKPVFVYTAAFNWHVNVQAAEWLCCEVVPELRSRLGAFDIQLVGRDPSPEVRALAQIPEVTVTGPVPEIGPYLLNATAAVVPLRYGSGVRYKILEAFAHGTPVVSTTVGCEGLGLRDGRDLLIADDPAAFATACERIVREPALRDTLAAGGTRAVTEANAASARAFRGVVEELAGCVPVGAA
jgi:polysaccharide biosynthesis protein PslH